MLPIRGTLSLIPAWVWVSLGGLILVAGLAIQTYRLDSAQNRLRVAEATTASIERSRDEVVRQYTLAIDRLTQALYEAQDRLSEYETLRKDPEVKEWGSQSIPNSVQELLNRGVP